MILTNQHRQPEIVTVDTTRGKTLDSIMDAFDGYMSRNGYHPEKALLSSVELNGLYKSDLRSASAKITTASGPGTCVGTLAGIPIHILSNAEPVLMPPIIITRAEFMSLPAMTGDEMLNYWRVRGRMLGYDVTEDIEISFRGEEVRVDFFALPF